MPLTKLNLTNNYAISSLEPLQGVPLKVLFFNGGSKIKDLSPLGGMPLTHLGWQNAPISDLSPLRGMPLADLSFIGSPVAALSPLQDCKSLKYVLIGHSAKVTVAEVAALQKALPDCKINWVEDPAKATTPVPLAPIKK